MSGESNLTPWLCAVLGSLVARTIIGSAWQASEPRWKEEVSVNSAISTFHSVVKLGPDFVCTCCHHMMYRKSVVLCTKAHYTKLDADVFNNVFSADISYIGSILYLM